MLVKGDDPWEMKGGPIPDHLELASRICKTEVFICNGSKNAEILQRDVSI